jgi:hypothetical protein
MRQSLVGVCDLARDRQRERHMANGVPENAVQEQPGLGGRERRAKRHRTTLASPQVEFARAALA